MKSIPKEFYLGGSKYTVELTSASQLGNTVAKIIYAKNRVIISDNFNGDRCTPDYMEASFYHELVHGILETMGKTDLSSDEGFVEGFANLLHQFEKTKA